MDGAMTQTTKRKNLAETNAGFSIIELLVVVTIIGILASIAIPAFRAKMLDAKISRIVTDLKSFEKGFITFKADTGRYPPDSHMNPPNHLVNGIGIEKYLPLNVWVPETPLGGHYNWEGPSYYPYAGISIAGTRSSVEQMEELDEVLDDGDITGGAFRITSNGRYTYIIDENP